MKPNRLTLIAHILFNVGFFTFFWGTFEIALDLQELEAATLWNTADVFDPIWSGTFGFPIPHHYIIGAIMAYAAYLLLSYCMTLQKRECMKKIKYWKYCKQYETCSKCPYLACPNRTEEFIAKD